MPGDGGGARAGVLAACTVVLGVAAHGEAGGAVALPSPAVLVIALAVGAVAALLGRHGRGALPTTVVLALGQVALHLSMPHPDAHAADAHAAGAHTVTGHAADAHAAMGHAVDAHAATLHTEAGAGTTPGMVATHALVTVLLALAVVGADRGVTPAFAWRAASSTLRAWPARLLPSDRVPSPRPVPAPWSFRMGVATVGTGVQVARVHRRRGPPGVVA